MRLAKVAGCGRQASDDIMPFPAVPLAKDDWQ